MSVCVNLVGFSGRIDLFPQPHTGLLNVSVRIRESLSATGNVYPQIDIPINFPAYVLRSQLLCQLYIQSSLSHIGHGLLLGVCHRLAHRMSSTAQRLNRDVAAAQAHYVHNIYSGFVFKADIEMITTTTAPNNELLGDQETTSNMADVYNIGTTGGGGFEFLEDDQVLIFDDVTSTSRSPTTSATGQLRPIDKLRKTEHELVDAGDDNIRDQLGDGGGCCSICMEDYLYDGNNKNNNNTKNIKLVRFGCTHIYHPTCILQWLDKHDSCPLCRRRLY